MSTNTTPISYPVYENTWFWRGAEARIDWPIAGLTVVCSANFADGVNHWRIFCIYADGCSIAMDMVKAEAGQLGGYLGVVLKPYAGTRNAWGTYPMTLRQGGVSLRNVLDALATGRLLRYRFHSGHEGWRHWIRSSIIYLQNVAGLLNDPSVAILETYIHYVWMSTEEYRPRTIAQGQFY